MGRNNRPMKTHPCQYRKEPAGRKRNTATKMTAKRERRMSRVLRLRGVDIGFAVYANDKERVAEAAIQIRRGETRACGRRRGGMNAKRREISLCAGRPFTRVKERKIRPAPLGPVEPSGMQTTQMTVREAPAGGGAAGRQDAEDGGFRLELED